MKIETEIKAITIRREALQQERDKTARKIPVDSSRLRRLNKRIGALTEKLQTLRARL